MRVVPPFRTQSPQGEQGERRRRSLASSLPARTPCTRTQAGPPSTRRYTPGGPRDAADWGLSLRRDPSRRHGPERQQRPRRCGSSGRHPSAVGCRASTCLTGLKATHLVAGPRARAWTLRASDRAKAGESVAAPFYRPSTHGFSTSNARLRSPVSGGEAQDLGPCCAGRRPLFKL